MEQIQKKWLKETGDTCEANALLKARAVPAIVSQSLLEKIRAFYGGFGWLPRC